jgi:hypothetical protein
MENVLPVPKKPLIIKKQKNVKLIIVKEIKLITLNMKSANAHQIYHSGTKKNAIPAKLINSLIKNKKHA